MRWKRSSVSWTSRAEWHLTIFAYWNPNPTSCTEMVSGTSLLALSLLLPCRTDTTELDNYIPETKTSLVEQPESKIKDVCDGDSKLFCICHHPWWNGRNGEYHLTGSSTAQPRKKHTQLPGSPRHWSSSYVDRVQIEKAKSLLGQSSFSPQISHMVNTVLGMWGTSGWINAKVRCTCLTCLHTISLTQSQHERKI